MVLGPSWSSFEGDGGRDIRLETTRQKGPSHFALGALEPSQAANRHLKGALKSACAKRVDLRHFG
jgi:hypothetical protein